MIRSSGVALRSCAILVIVIVSLHLLWFNLPNDYKSAFQLDPPKPAPAPKENDDAVEYPNEPLAKQIKASELLSRPPTYTNGRIPKIFHQSWISLQLPRKFQSWSRSCRRNHPDWEWVIWTDDDNLQLVQKHFPWLEHTYRGLPSEIYRADLARYLYMYIYGGVYADLDTECLRSTETLQPTYGQLFGGSEEKNNTALFGRMGTDPSFEHSIPNAWMAASPGHPFFLVTMNEVKKRFKLIENRWSWTSVKPAETITGPVALRAAITEYDANKEAMKDAVREHATSVEFQGEKSKDDEVVLLPSHAVYPYSWGSDGERVRNVCWVVSNGFNAKVCKKRLAVERDGSIAITYWSHTHSPSGHNKGNMKHIE